MIKAIALSYLGRMTMRFIGPIFKRQALGDFDCAPTRERLIRTGRIVIIDDEMPLLISELKEQGFSVDHDQSGNDLHKIDNQLYDVAIVDYHGVGQRLGKAQGLDLLKHIRRVSPRTRVIAFTSRSLSASESEFFTLSHAVLPKDLGLNDSLVIVETELQKAFQKEHLFEALLGTMNVTDPSTRDKLRNALITSLQKKQETGFREVVSKAVGKLGEKAVDAIIAHLFQDFS